MVRYSVLKWKNLKVRRSAEGEIPRYPPPQRSLKGGPGGAEGRGAGGGREGRVGGREGWGGEGWGGAGWGEVGWGGVGWGGVG